MDRFYIRFAAVAVVLVLLGTAVGEEVDGNEKNSLPMSSPPPPSVEVPNSSTDLNDTSEVNRTVQNPTNSSSMMGNPGTPPPLLPPMTPLNGTLNPTVSPPPPPLAPLVGTLNSSSSPSLPPLNGTLNSTPPPPPSLPSNLTSPPPSPLSLPPNLTSPPPPLSIPPSNSTLNATLPSPLSPPDLNPVLLSPATNGTFGSNKTVDIPKCSESNATNCFDGRLVVCLWHPQDGSKKLFIILENKGGKSLNVTIITQPIMNYKFLPENSFDKFEISSAVNSPVVLNSKNSNCTINPTSDHHLHQPSPPSQFGFTLPPIYTLQPSPIYFAYAFFLIALISVGACACCRFWRGDSRSADAGIQYQQLEMGVHQTQTATSLVSDVEAPPQQQQGWDQWEDDWEEETTSNPQQKKANGGDMSSNNGHTSTNATKDGWEDWDD